MEGLVRQDSVMVMVKAGGGGESIPTEVRAELTDLVVAVIEMRCVIDAEQLMQPRGISRS